MSNFENRIAFEFENEGQKLFGVFHEPINSDKYPLVIICHGFAGTKVGKARAYVALSEELAKAGIASYRFDFRGSGDSEGALSEMTLDGEVADVLCALEQIKNHSQINYKIDFGKIGIFGCSLGGTVAMLAAERQPLFKSLVLWAPAFHSQRWKELWKMSQQSNLDYKKKLEMMQMNGSTMSESFLKQFFELNIEQKLALLNSKPILHIHGELDQVIDLSHADFFKTCRENVVGLTKQLRLPNTNHDFSYPEEQALAIKETATWFFQTLN